MDEVDSIGSARIDSGGGGGGGDSEVQRTMLELLNQLDGFEATNKIKVGLYVPQLLCHRWDAGRWALAMSTSGVGVVATVGCFRRAAPWG